MNDSPGNTQNPRDERQHPDATAPDPQHRLEPFRPQAQPQTQPQSQPQADPAVGRPPSSAPTFDRRPWYGRLWFRASLVTAALLLAALAFSAEWILQHREPILRKRVIETLSARFNAPVELDRLDISLLKGIQVQGSGLRIYPGKQPEDANVTPASENASPQNAATTPQPILRVEHFQFRTTWQGLLHQPTAIHTVYVQGMELHIPPPSRRGQLLGPRQGAEPADLHNPNTRPKIAFTLDQFLCKDVRLLLDTDRPGKDPLEFDISDLDLTDIGPGQPFSYTANLVNPKPVGDIHATGHFGPWNPGDPRQTALDGNYSFTHADLDTIKGIGGMLSSTGRFSGVLEKIAVDGQTDTPDFSVDTANHPLPLHTTFHAVVDGTDGDTYLEPVQARLAHSSFTARGKVVRVPRQGHDIDLDVDVPDARIEDFLRLGVKTTPTLMNGRLALRAHLHIPPGQQRVPLKLEIAGNFHIAEVRFNNSAMQDKVDGLSARASGHPDQILQVSHNKTAEVHSEMQAAHFNLSHGQMTVQGLQYQIPGALVLLDGVYSMDGNLFDFAGHVRTDARASQMVTGWKRWLLKPVDPFLAKNGAGVELPIQISGTEGDVHFGLARHGKADESAAELAADLRQHRAQLLQDAREHHQAELEEHRAAQHDLQVEREMARAGSLSTAEPTDDDLKAVKAARKQQKKDAKLEKQLEKTRH